MESLSIDIDTPSTHGIKELLANNIGMPHANVTEFNLADGPASSSSFAEVSVVTVASKDIVGSSTLSSWGDSDSLLEDSDQADRTLRCYKQFLNGEVPPPLHLYHYGEGKYFVADGQRRVALAKALGISRLPARIIDVNFNQMKLPNDSVYQEMAARQAAGLWQGELSFSLDIDGQYNGGLATISCAEGPWVFAKNMNDVRAAYSPSKDK